MTKRYFVASAKAGRCTNAFQNDHGIVRHAVDAEKYTWGSKVKSLCGTRPGVRSVGFVADHGEKEVTCKACLKRLSRIKEYEILDTSKDDANGRALWVHYLSDFEEGNKIIDQVEAVSFPDAEFQFQEKGYRGGFLITASYGAELSEIKDPVEDKEPENELTDEEALSEFKKIFLNSGN